MDLQTEKQRLSHERKDIMVVLRAKIEIPVANLPGSIIIIIRAVLWNLYTHFSSFDFSLCFVCRLFELQLCFMKTTSCEAEDQTPAGHSEFGMCLSLPSVLRTMENGTPFERPLVCRDDTRRNSAQNAASGRKWVVM